MPKDKRYDFESTYNVDPEAIFKKIIDQTEDRIYGIHNSNLPLSWVTNNPGMRPQLAFERLLTLYELNLRVQYELSDKYSQNIETAFKKIEDEIIYLTENYNIDTEHRYFPDAIDQNPALVPKPKALNEKGEGMRKRGIENTPIRKTIIREARMILESGGKPRSY